MSLTYSNSDKWTKFLPVICPVCHQEVMPDKKNGTIVGSHPHDYEICSGSGLQDWFHEEKEQWLKETPQTYDLLEIIELGNDLETEIKEHLVNYQSYHNDLWAKQAHHHRLDRMTRLGIQRTGLLEEMERIEAVKLAVMSQSPDPTGQTEMMSCMIDSILLLAVTIEANFGGPNV